MNRVYFMGSTKPLNPIEIAAAANAITKNKPFTKYDFMGRESRISGSGHCYCDGNGEFELLPVSNKDALETGKRYMVCRKCGAASHL